MTARALHRRMVATIAVTVGLLAGLLVAQPVAASAATYGYVSGTISGDPSEPWPEQQGLSVALQTPTGAYVTSQVINSPGTAFQMSAPAGSYVLAVGYAGPGNFIAPTPIPVTVVAGETSVVNPVLDRGARIEGVISADVGALVDPWIRIERTDFFGFVDPSRIHIDPATGHYEIVGLTSGGYRVLFGDADPPGRYSEQYWGGATNQESATPIEVVAGSDYPDHDVTLQHVNRVSGTVTARRPDGTIAPARWALVEAVTPYGTAKATTADDNGDYELLRLEPGTYQIRFSMNGEATNWVSQTLDPLVVDDGTYLTGVDALLETGGSITGTVTTASPEQASAPLDFGTARLYAQGADGRWTESRSTAIRGGWYSFTGVAVGSYRLRFEADDPWSWGSEYYDGPVRGEDADLITIESGTALTGLDATLDPRGIYVSRIGGADRYEVSANVSSTVFGADRLIQPPIPVLYIASGANYPDALSAGPAAIHEGGDLLLVAPDSLPDATRREIEQLQPTRIVVVGGPVSVSERVFAELAALQPNIVRIGGADRYEVSRKLVGYAFCGSVSGSGCADGGADSVFFATGSNFPDALTAGPAAGHVNAPVLLVPGSNAKPDAPTLALLQRLGAQTGYISGGPNSVSVSFEAALGRALSGGSLTRFSGADRFEVASTMNDWIFSGSETAFLASGAVFADALSGGPVAGALDAPLYLSRPECIPVGAIDGIVELNVVDLVLLGGPATLRPEVEAGAVCS